MRVLMILLPVAAVIMLAACDKAPAPAGQEQAAATAAPATESAKPANSGKPADIGLESSNGMSANLSYANAGRAAPDAVFIGADGRDVHLADFAGRPLLVNIWATWCAPCKAEMPTLDRLAAQQEGKLSVVAVSQDLEGRRPVQAYFQSAKFANLEPYIDPDNRLLSALGSNVTLPTTILYNAEGKEVWRVMGGVEWDDAEMANLLAEAD
jgi:thiol-disulfide isomerase/thioredoxin